MKRKYLFLMKTEGIAGAERLQIDYFKSINFNKYDVDFGIIKDIFSPYLKRNSLPVKIVYLPEFNKREGFSWKILKHYKFFKSVKPDSIVFNQFWLQSFALPEIIAAFLATKGNSYMIVHDCPPVHPKYKSKLHFGFLPGIGLSWRKERLLQTLLYYFTRSTIAVSEASREMLVKLHKFRDHKVKVVHHGVDTNQYVASRENRVRLRKELNIPDSDYIVVSTARLYALKRVDRLIEAFAILCRERKDVHLIIVGTGPDQEKLIKKVEALDGEIRKKIRFLGFQDDIPSILQLSDIYVLPSDSEGLPLAPLEAMSCGLISVVTNCGGPAEIIKDGWNGFLVEKSTDGVLNGLKKSLNLGYEEKDKISGNARRFVEENFNVKENIKSGLKLLGMN